MLQLLNPTITAVVDMSSVTLSYIMPTTVDSTGGNYNLQLFLQRTSDGGYEAIVPRDTSSTPIRIALFPKGAVNTGTVKVTLKPDTYSGGKAVLFAEGLNFNDPNAYSFGVATTFTIATSAVRVVKPIFTPGVPSVGLDGKVTVPFDIKYPGDPAVFDPKSLPYNGFIYQGKGDVTDNNSVPWGWVTTDKFISVTANGDTYMMYNGTFVLTPTSTPGLKNLQFGLYNQSWSMFGWVWPGVTFALPNWVQKADPAKYPAFSTAFAKGKSPVAIGGNFGNALASIGAAANDSSQYFTLLAAEGLTCIRLNFDSDKYLTDPIYPDVVDQVVQHILMAGVVPCIAPQDMPSGGAVVAEASLVKLAGIIAARYAGVPIIQDVLNEPHGYATWAAWKPVAQRAIDAIKAASPNAQIVVGGEGFSPDLTQASASPFPAGTILAYCAHIYDSNPANVAGHCGSTLPVWVQEYQTPDPAWHSAVAALPNVMGVAAWAWTTPGQDSLNLVQNVAGAVLTLTATGQSIANIYQAWMTGQSPAPAPAPAPTPAPAPVPTGGPAQPPVVMPPGPTPAPVASGVSLADVQALLTALKAQQDAASADAAAKAALVIAAIQAKIVVDEAQTATDEARLNGDEARLTTDEAAVTAIGGTVTALGTAAGLLKAQEAADIAALKLQLVPLRTQLILLQRTVNALSVTNAVAVQGAATAAVTAATPGIIAAVYAKIRAAFSLG